MYVLCICQIQARAATSKTTLKIEARCVSIIAIYVHTVNLIYSLPFVFTAIKWSQRT